MKTSQHDRQNSSTICPAQVAANDQGMPRRDDVLVLPKHRRMVVQYVIDEANNTNLCLFYGDKEIVFNEPDLFPFGEALARQPRFIACAAAGWGQGYEWPRIQAILQQLIDEGVLVHEANIVDDSAPPDDGVRSAPLPASTCPNPRHWNECEAITRELAGRPVELGYLELIVPVFRIAHIALDADQRQVGEANVFPPALRLDVPTEWRTCHLPGTRFQSERPMNVTAMRVMRTHWQQMMAAVLHIRAAYLRRFPQATEGWTVGHVERLSTAVLAVPTYHLMRCANPAGNGSLHPALSSLFRVTDGVRMTMHQMLFVPIGEPARSPDQTVSVDDIYDYAERNYSFHSQHGVCAGPKAMVHELLQVLLNGVGLDDYAGVQMEPAVRAALDDLEAALDYGFLGLQAYAAVFSLWPAMTRTYDQLAGILETTIVPDDCPAARLRDRLLAHQATLRNATYLGHERWRASREDVYIDMYQQCGRGLREATEVPGLEILLTPVPSEDARRGRETLQSRLHQILAIPGSDSDQAVQHLTTVIMDFLFRAQAILRVAEQVQSKINHLLGRDAPQRRLAAADIDVHNLLQGVNPKRLPYLLTELEHLLQIRIELDAAHLSVTEWTVPA